MNYINNKLSDIRVCYDSPDLTGDRLVRPLKAYQSPFGRKIVQCDEKGRLFRKIGFRIGQVAAGVFAYPAIGSLALIGLVVKYCEMRRHNAQVLEIAKDFITELGTKGDNESLMPVKGLEEVDPNGVSIPKIKGYKVHGHEICMLRRKIKKETQAVMSLEAAELINQATSKMRTVYLYQGVNGETRKLLFVVHGNAGERIFL